MSIATQQAPTSPATPAGQANTTIGDRRYRLTVAQYHAMGEAGIFGAGDRIELLEGQLITKMSKNERHMISTELVQEVFTLALPVGWYISMQNPITIADADSEPEPDAKVMRGLRRDYEGRRIFPTDVALAIEVSDTSIRDDQTSKKALYAFAAIPFYWIINLRSNRLEVYSNPTGPNPTPDYRNQSDHGPDDIVPLILDGQEIARIDVRDLLPRI